MKSFSSSSLKKEIIQVLTDKNIMIPTEIQEQAIPILLEHNGDFVGRSETGSGKTIAFGAPLLTRINPEIGKVQAVILTPTRELAEQVGTELIDLGKNIPNLKIEAIYGGMSMKAQTHVLSNGVQVIIATPGRLMDLVRRKIVSLSALDFIIFDEADEMLIRGFQSDIDSILATTNRSYATWLFSATMPTDIDKIIKKYLKKSLKMVGIGEENSSNKRISHQYVEVTAEEKLDVLLHFLTRLGTQKGIIFCRTKSGVQKLYKQLSTNKFSCGAINGDLPQGLRNKVMDQFREGHIQLLIATDVAARGLDIENIQFVLQYHVPDTPEAFTHRSGRTSRAGKSGVNITFVFPEEAIKFVGLQAELDIDVERLDLPSPKDQLVNKAILWGRRVAKAKPVHDKLDDPDREQFKSELEHLTKDEMMEKMLAVFLRDNQ